MARFCSLRIAALAAASAAALQFRNKAPLEGTFTLYQYRGRFCASGGKGHTGEYGALILMKDQMAMMTTHSGEVVCNRVRSDGASYIVDSCRAHGGTCPLTCSSCPEKFVKHFDLDTCYEGWLLSKGGPPGDCGGERKFCKNVDQVDLGLARWCNKWPAGEVEVEVTGYGGHYEGEGATIDGPTPSAPKGGEDVPTPPAPKGGKDGPTPPAPKGGKDVPTPPAPKGGKDGPTPPAPKGGEDGPTPPASKGDDKGPTPPPSKGNDQGPTPPASKGDDKGPTPPPSKEKEKVDEWGGDEWGDAEESEADGVLVALGARCGTKGQLLSSNVEDVRSCAALAEGAKVEAFTMGKGIHDGKCYAETLDVNDKLIAEWNANKADPPCPANGGWTKDKNYDFYYLAKEEETMFFMAGPLVTPRFNETTII